ncbi:hypothetical protein COCC4DRAFT_147404 [Bipolaris maydis ATCC 48331]|uniref:Rhodopsin domain-containing protein n=2 Tax=Cochliobolus heterostrophus TaxID=5016 RepID=M2V3R1_COCH5|nr:uncharacterized protein COCC4DRAFT_147404 [Bipolaris maydis ATCC 48331]EMD94642.1 hypothetical protein COCHEDRAFT_1092587 [Bipolaris maydis C5]KAJ5029076.1 hypothetical protein J3E73DRAFT_366449 [Bipolaris maydis]ENI01647.1 hypothetical protein COCC4DRAFT_147404 [Bipolaris maydis ATCC 48331]KAJ6215177.1 hypothetical protein PSV09DRAFT_1092587 [Bipolaris maydis]KAJ6276305.1 hypothetical protein PSV08DRAFT_170006 [Bipolaris maydis]
MDVYSQSSHAGGLVARGGGLHPPPEVLLNWPKPNYVDPEERGWAAPIVLLMFLGVTFLVYVARMWARIAISKNTGLDDILISLSMIPLFGLTIATVLGIRIYGYQWHSWDQTTETLVTSREIALAIELLYMISTSLIKVSILCFYRRITGRLTHQFVYWVYATIAFCVIYGVVFTFVILFTCTPIEGFWRYFDIAWRIQNKLVCRDEGAIIVACAAISSVQDFIICLLPVLLIWNLQISKRQKLALCGIFGMGLITCFCGLMRTYYATKLYYFTYDITWIAYYGWIWTNLEAQLAVICASAPSLKVFFNRYLTQYTSRDGYTGNLSRGNPPEVASKLASNAFVSKQSQFSSHKSQIRGGDATSSEEIPLDGIHVNHKLQISIEERDDSSYKSFESTKALTELPPSHQVWRDRIEWAESCRNVCAAFRPGSMGNPGIRSREGDIEAGRAI